MTPEQSDALFRLHRRANMMHSEARTWLFNAAVQSGDVEARQLAMNVVTALDKLIQHTHEAVY